MKEIFKLSPIEKIAQKTLFILLLLFAIIMIKGIYNQEYKIDQNFILIPCMYGIGILFLIIYTINGFTSGNIVRNWIIGNRLSGPVFHSIFSIAKGRDKINPDNALILTTKIFGSITLCGAIFLLYKAFHFFTQQKSRNTHLFPILSIDSIDPLL